MSLEILFKWSKEQKTIAISDTMTKASLISAVAQEFFLDAKTVKLIMPALTALKSDALVIKSLASLSPKKFIMVIGTAKSASKEFETLQKVGDKIMQDQAEEDDYSSFFLDGLQKERLNHFDNTCLTNVPFSAYEIGLVEWDKLTRKNTNLKKMLQHAAYFGLEKRAVEILRQYLPDRPMVRSMEEYKNKTTMDGTPLRLTSTRHAFDFLASETKLAIDLMVRAAIIGRRLKFVQWALTEYHSCWSFAPATVCDDFRLTCRPDLASLIEYSSTWSDQLGILEFLYSLMPRDTRLSTVDCSSCMEHGHLRQLKWLMTRGANVKSLDRGLENGCVRSIEWLLTKNHDQDHDKMEDLAKDFEQSLELEAKEHKRQVLKRHKYKHLMNESSLVKVVEKCQRVTVARELVEMILPLISNSDLEKAFLTCAILPRRILEAKQEAIFRIDKEIQNRGIAIDNLDLFLNACEHSTFEVSLVLFSRLEASEGLKASSGAIARMPKRFARFCTKIRAIEAKLKPETDRFVENVVETKTATIQAIDGSQSNERKIAKAEELYKNKQENDRVRDEIKLMHKVEQEDIVAFLTYFVKILKQSGRSDEIVNLQKSMDSSEFLVECWKNIS